MKNATKRKQALQNTKPITGVQSEPHSPYEDIIRFLDNNLKCIFSSNDENIKRECDIADRELENLSDARERFFDYYKNQNEMLVSLCNNPNTTPEERETCLKIVQENNSYVNENHNRICAQESEIVRIVVNEVSEHRRLTNNVIKALGYIGWGAGVLGLVYFSSNGKHRMRNIKLPIFS